jgi:dihydrolipoamide dehydrogenase
MLAHKAEEDGAAVAEWIAGKAGHINWDLVPGIVYTDPEVASVGLGEDEAKAAASRQHRQVQLRRQRPRHRRRRHRRLCEDHRRRQDRQDPRRPDPRPNAGELISEVVTHMEYGGSAEDLGRTIHAHPTMSEAVKEAGLAVNKSAIHAL